MLKGPNSRPLPRNLRLTRRDDIPPEKPPKAEPIEAPEWLDADSKEIFVMKAAQIRANGYWQDLYEDALALLATLLAEHRRDPAGLSAAKLTQLRLLLSELGLTPQSARGVTK